MNLDLAEKFIDHNDGGLFNSIADRIAEERDKLAYNIIKPYIDKYGKATQVQMLCDSREETFIFRYLVEWEDKYGLTFTVKVPVEGS